NIYTRAKNLFLAATNSNSGKEELLEAGDLLNQALARDPSYFEAYCQLGGIHDLLYILGDDHSPRRLNLAERAIDAAFRLRPNAGEAHLARATDLYSRSEEHTSELQSPCNLVCRLLLEKKKNKKKNTTVSKQSQFTQHHTHAIPIHH